MDSCDWAAASSSRGSSRGSNLSTRSRNLSCYNVLVAIVITRYSLMQNTQPCRKYFSLARSSVAYFQQLFCCCCCFSWTCRALLRFSVDCFPDFFLNYFFSLRLLRAIVVEPRVLQLHSPRRLLIVACLLIKPSLHRSASARLVKAQRTTHLDHLYLYLYDRRPSARCWSDFSLPHPAAPSLLTFSLTFFLPFASPGLPTLFSQLIQLISRNARNSPTLASPLHLNPLCC